MKQSRTRRRPSVHASWHQAHWPRLLGYICGPHHPSCDCRNPRVDAPLCAECNETVLETRTWTLLVVPPCAFTRCPSAKEVDLFLAVPDADGVVQTRHFNIMSTRMMGLITLYCWTHPIKGPIWCLASRNGYDVSWLKNQLVTRPLLRLSATSWRGFHTSRRRPVSSSSAIRTTSAWTLNTLTAGTAIPSASATPTSTKWLPTLLESRTSRQLSRNWNPPTRRAAFRSSHAKPSSATRTLSAWAVDPIEAVSEWQTSTTFLGQPWRMQICHRQRGPTNPTSCPQRECVLAPSITASFSASRNPQVTGAFSDILYELPLPHQVRKLVYQCPSSTMPWGHSLMWPMGMTFWASSRNSSPSSSGLCIRFSRLVIRMQRQTSTTRRPEDSQTKTNARAMWTHIQHNSKDNEVNRRRPRLPGPPRVCRPVPPSYC